MTTSEFNTSLQTMSSILHAFAYNLTKNTEEAKDLYQETAYRAITNIEKFNTGTNLKAWLFTIMKNIFINNYRKKIKANTVSDDTENLYYINGADRSVGNVAETTILMKELQILIDALDDSVRIPFMMHYYGYKYQEIAEQLDLPLGTVKSRIFFARKEMKDRIEEDYGSTYAVRV